MTRTQRTIALSAIAAAMAFGGSGIAQAKHGADDPAGHVRHAQGADDAVKGKHGADDPAGDARRGRGADDPAGDNRAKHGADDRPNHG